MFALQIGLIFVFNLIVGTGALTLPSAFAKTGWLLGFVLIVVLAFISYVTVTFVIEAMACANAISYWTRLQVMKRDCVSPFNASISTTISSCSDLYNREIEIISIDFSIVSAAVDK